MPSSKKYRFLQLVFFFSLFFSAPLLKPTKIFAIPILWDNFDDNNASGWVVARSMQWADPSLPCKNGSVDASWEVVDGKYGIKIDGPGCVTESVPDDSRWNDEWQYYAIEFDMEFVGGTDKNIAWRYTEAGEANVWYDIHFVTPSLFLYQNVPAGSGIYTSYTPLYNGNTYHLRIEVRPGNFRTFVNENLELDAYFDPANDVFPYGKLALQASSSDVAKYSEVYFDNIVICDNLDGSCEFPEILDVPYSSQDDGEWAGDTYDSTDATIGELGCALTSAVMVMQYHGIDQLPDGTPLDVGSLNDWLNERGNGYWRQGITSWGELTKLSEILHESDPTYPILGYQPFDQVDFAEFDRILTEEGNPLIFTEAKPESPSKEHFIVANGVIQSTAEYAILDPLTETRTQFLIPPDELLRARYLYPLENEVGGVATTDLADLSYLFLHADEGLRVLITDPIASRSGVTAEGEILNEIENASFALGYPLFNSVDPTADTGSPFWEFSGATPLEGDYTLSFTATESGRYDFELYAYDSGANAKTYKKHIYVHPEYTLGAILSYQPDGGEDFAVLTKEVDFDTLRNDVRAMRDDDYIHEGWTMQFLLETIDLADLFYPAKPDITRKFLNLFETQVEKYYPRFITNEAHDYLLDELKHLRKGLGVE